jgi:hypothetical protein
LTDTNEAQNTVTIKTTVIPSLNPSVPTSLPPFSMTVFTWPPTTTPLNAQGVE